MGIFDFFKKNKKESVNTSAFDFLSGKGLVEHIRSRIDNPTDEKVMKVLSTIAKPDDDQEHLTAKGELPWGWYTRNLPIVKTYEDAIAEIAVKLKPLKGIERIKQLEKLISKYDEFKRFCYKKDECYIKYFSDMWEHCHNSRCKDFEYITPYIEELKKLNQ